MAHQNLTAAGLLERKCCACQQDPSSQLPNSHIANLNCILRQFQPEKLDMIDTIHRGWPPAKQQSKDKSCDHLAG